MEAKVVLAQIAIHLDLSNLQLGKTLLAGKIATVSCARNQNSILSLSVIREAFSCF